MPSVRTVRLPKSDFDGTDLPIMALKGFDLRRVHSQDFPAISFRNVSSHRYSHGDSPEGLLYLGEIIETCLWECFGDELLDTQSRIASSRWKNSHLSKIHSASTFRICDLADEKVRLKVGVDLSALMDQDLSVPQEWGLAIQNHPSGADGIRYLSRFNHRPGLVLFERPGMAAKLNETVIGALPVIREANRFLIDNRIALV